ncbi:hypothetical protein CH373_13305 [Leptospira perolatii]|uniref:Uncharacterized protein n=1 Tax=Leptospira perolatii TaxID=2023191 RepID=A0A2M9ZKV2_9LEPT|nr:hypothetical protein [Leptospira perolatii]PJZ69914.1 hypothetical protein CH360_08380 [Leptospira perolatii]PJZ72678.1 hypothetical protein CH373_13305 [Leptospira perolatii]
MRFLLYFFRFLFIIAAIVSMESCKDILIEARKDITIENALKLKSYSGILSEKIGENLIRSEVKWQKPNQYFAKVTSKGNLSGTIVSQNGANLKIYYPSTKFGVEFLNLNLLNEEQTKNLYEEIYNWTVKKFEVELGDTENQLAGKKTVELLYRPKENHDFFFKWRTWVYDEYSFPIKTEIINPNGSDSYSYEFDSISFNDSIQSEKFKFEFPNRSVIATWNFSSKNYPLDSAQKVVNFKIRTPEYTKGLELVKVIKLDSQVPGIMMLYQKGPYILGISQMKDYGIPLFPIKKGIRLNGKKELDLHFLGTISAIHFLSNGVHYYLVSNLPYQELASVADSI